MEDTIDQVTEDAGALGDSMDELTSDLEDANDKMDDFEDRIDALEANATADVLEEIRDNGLYVSDRWRIFEGSNSDLLIRDTQTSNNPSYRFVSGGRDTFGDE